MKKCPSCNATCDDAVDLCPVCGHDFDGSTGAGAPMRTMMGLPSLGLPSEGEESEAGSEVDLTKQTLFGFPAQKTEQFSLRRMQEGFEEDAAPVEEEEVDDDDDYEAGATFIMPASQFQFPDNDGDLRGTVAGRPVKPRPPNLADSDRSDDGSGPPISGSAYFAASAKPGAPSRHLGGTLMGMSLEELEGRREAEDALLGDDDESPTNEVSFDTMRATAFGVPGIGAGGRPAQREESSDATVDDSPTQAWKPGKEAALSDADSRKALLEKIRRSKSGGGDTSRGIPAAPAPSSRNATQRGVGAGIGEGLDLDALRKLKPKRELVATPSEFPVAPAPQQEERKGDGTPAHGVVKAPRRSSTPAPSATAPQTPEAKTPASVPGAYMLGRGEAPRADEPPPSRGVPLAQIRPVTRSIEEIEAQKGIGDDLSDADFAFAETGVATPNLLAQAGLSLTGEPLDLPVPAKPRDLGEPSQSLPSGAARQHQPTPVATQPLHQMSAAQPTAPGMPGQTPHPAYQTQQPGVHETHDGPRAAGSVTTASTARPNLTKHTAAPAPEDPTVRFIQSVFAALSGVITLVVLAFVVLEGLPQSTVGTLVAAFAVTLGVAALFTAAPIWSSQVRSKALVVLGVLLSLCALAFVAGIVPKMFVVLGLAAFVAFMAAAFPSIAGKLL